MNGPKAIEPSADVVAIWGKILESGLAPASSDEEFVEALCKTLHLDPGQDIKRELERAKPTVVEFLSAFLTCCKAFDEMAQDIWDIFVKADARFSDNNLQIAFDFSKDQPEGLKFNLDHFKAFIEQYRRLQESVLTVPLASDFLWGLWGQIRSEDRSPSSVTLAEWVARYEDGQWPSALPQLPSTGDARLDITLGATSRAFTNAADVCGR